MTRLALGGERIDDRVDLVLGADVDAAGRLVEDQHVRVGEHPLGQHHLLLVAARQLAARWLARVGALMCMSLRKSLGDHRLLVLVDDRTPCSTFGRDASVTLRLMSSIRLSP